LGEVPVGRVGKDRVAEIDCGKVDRRPRQVKLRAIELLQFRSYIKWLLE
jgi:hypothetical protein